MLSRKPVPSRNPEQASSAPYPASPTAPSATDSHASAYQPPTENDLSLHRSRSSSASSHNTWNSGFSSDHENDDNNQPKPENSDIPASLRVGRSQPSLPAQQSFQSHNPYHNLHNQSQSQTQVPPYPSEDSQSIWSSAPVQPTAAPPPPPSHPPPSLPPAPTFAALSLDDHVQQNSNAEGLGPPPPVIPQKSSRRSLVSQTSSNPWQQDLDRGQNIQTPWQSTPSPQPHQLGAIFQPPPGPPPSLVPPPRRDYQSTPSPPPASAAPPLAFNPEPATAPSAPPPPPLNQQYTSPLSQSIVNPPAPQEESLIDFGTVDAPPPPAANLEPVSAPQPERTNLAAPIESAEELLSKQRNVTYQIKQINWFDAAAGPNGSMRRCPILTQNANGPCPLLALVNALTLSAPEGSQTILVDTLSSREQISLGLLLDAVFEELARRTEISSKALPDVGDLYSFLITLHTGMNVNPRFVTPPNAPQGKPGGFDDTREMRLYSAFEVPLVHGWVPTSMSSAYEAFDRSAKTFDDAQNIQFAQAELEHKLGTDGLSAQEQQLFEDIINIKEFMTSYPTQLTEHGLKLMTDSFKPGQIAILFRNDHFSTLYKQPRSGTLMNLVTDAGYASHDEIVWESLVDVSGAAGSFFSGDFRPVGNTPSGVQNGNNWQNVPSGNNGNLHSGAAAGSTSAGPQSQPPTEPRGHGSEQEDADLALALQLQEEEEDQQRQAEASRRRQDELSRQFLERESASSGRSPTSEQRPPVPPRRSNMNTNSNSSRNNAPPTADAPYIRERDDGDEEPPTYEQAASDRPYRPAGATRDPRQGDALGALTALQMQQGPFANQNGSNMNGQPPSMHRRRSSAMGLGRTNSNSQRLRRQQSQGQGPQAGAGTGPAPQYSGYVPPGSGGRISQAEREERCNVM